MDDKTFDRIARRFEALASRRDTLGALLGAGLLSAFGGFRLKVMAKGKKKEKKKCKPKSLNTTCAGRCGSVKNTCKKTVDCGDCSICQRCTSAGTCEPDPDQLGDDCGSDRVCLANGSCQACGAADEACCPPTNTCDLGTVCVSGTCEPCGFLNAPCCSSNNCVPSPGLGCFDGICEECGDTGEQCCPNDICETGRVCLVGVCQDDWFRCCPGATPELGEKCLSDDDDLICVDRTANGCACPPAKPLSCDNANRVRCRATFNDDRGSGGGCGDCAASAQVSCNGVCMSSY